jgi:RNA polymerase sigma-70 factor (ECF subfamily)
MGVAADELKALVEAHFEALYRYAFRLTGSAADAEDLTQETYGKAFTRIEQLRDRERAKAWLFRILRNLYLHKVRDEKRHRIVPIDSVGELPGREAPDVPDISPEELQVALNDLEEGFRSPLILFYFEDFSYRQIADQMELPIGTVMSRLARAKAYLREKLTPLAECSPTLDNPAVNAGAKLTASLDVGKTEVPGAENSVKKGRKEVTDAVS